MMSTSSPKRRHSTFSNGRPPAKARKITKRSELEALSAQGQTMYATFQSLEAGAQSIISLRADLKETQANLKKAEGKSDAFHQTSKKLNRQLAEKTEKYNILQEENASLQKENESVKKEKASLQNDNESVKKENDGLKEKVEQLAQESKESSNEMKLLKNENAIHQDDVLFIEARYKEMLSRYDRAIYLLKKLQTERD